MLRTIQNSLHINIWHCYHKILAFQGHVGLDLKTGFSGKFKLPAGPVTGCATVTKAPNNLRDLNSLELTYLDCSLVLYNDNFVGLLI